MKKLLTLSIPLIFVFLLLPFAAGNGSPLISAVLRGDTAEAQKLIKEGADVNARYDNGLTALIFASGFGYKKIVSALLEAKADPDAQYISGETALMTASHEGFSEIVSMLLKAKANPDLQSNKGAAALILAAQNGHKKLYPCCLRQRPILIYKAMKARRY
jgi:ankyrin repeat protein